MVTEEMRESEMKEKKRKPQLLYREADGRWAFRILPEELPEVLAWVHDVCGHWSHQRTLKKCIGKIYWFKRAKDVSEFCRTCQNCQLMGPMQRNKRIPHPILQMQPMNLIRLHYLGPTLLVTIDENLYVLLMVDYFIGMCFLKAVPLADSTEAAKFPWEVFRWMGRAIAIYSKGGRHFKAEVTRLLKLQEMPHFISSPSHPQSVGMAEKIVKLILHRLQKYHVDDLFDVEDHWDR